MTAQVGNYIVRDLNPWDGERLFVLTGNLSTMKYMGLFVHKSADEATKLIQRYRSAQSKYQAVCHINDPGDILGVVGMEVQRHQVALTIMFRNDWKTRGAGRGFSVPFVKWIFTHPQIWRVWAYCHVDNVSVQRVLERMGAEREGRLRRFEVFPNVSTEPQNVYVYAITR